MEKTRLKPVLDGEFWMIGGNPDLGELQGRGDREGTGGGGRHQECVDHHVFQSLDGAWHLWGCIRGTKVGRILYHWETGNLTDTHWEKRGEIIRADHIAGESINGWAGEEWIQSPYVIKEGDTYYMFFGGHTTGYDKHGSLVPRDDKRVECQLNLMTSKDGRNWVRHRNEKGQSRILVGPGETRDPCLIKIDGLWYIYYAGYEYVGEEIVAGVYARTSENLVDWSDWKLVHRDHNPIFGGHYWDTECPHVIKRNGYYYLFRTENYAKASTNVFRSEDPLNFGIDNAMDKFVGKIAVAAPEIIVDKDGQEFITSNHDLQGGTQLCRLKWVKVE